MSKKAWPFRETDIRRALRAARKEGIEYPTIEIDTKHQRLRIISQQSDKCADATADEELAQWRKTREHAHSS